LKKIPAKKSSNFLYLRILFVILPNFGIILPQEDIGDKRGKMMDEKSVNEISQRLSEVISDSGLSKKGFALKLKVSGSFITQIQQSKSKPGFEFILNLIKVFNVNLNWFFTGKGEKYLNEKKIDRFEKLRELYPSLDREPLIDDLLYDLQIPLMKHLQLASYLLNKRENQEYIDNYFENFKNKSEKG
jgi:transcriptional regulator with XRE-family HTH domain